MFNCCQYTEKSSVLNELLLCSVQLDERTLQVRIQHRGFIEELNINTNF